MPERARGPLGPPITQSPPQGLPASVPAVSGQRATFEHYALLDRAVNRSGWSQLSPLRREHATALLLAAEAPSLGILCNDNEAMRRRLGLSAAQWQKLARALKETRLLDVQRRWSGVPGNYREAGPASWLYAPDDSPRQSQIPRKRLTQTDARLRRLERENAVQRDDLNRMQGVMLDAISLLQEHLPTGGVKPGVKP